MQNIAAEKKVLPGKGGKRAGGRPPSEGWQIYDFIKIDGDKNRKCLAKCMRCQSVLKNTSISRMRNHRRKCGTLKSNLIESKTENENDIDHEETISPTAVANTIVWTPEHFEGIVDEPDQTIEKVNQTTYEIIQTDIQRHSDIQRHKKSSSSKRRRSSIDSSSIDVSLSRFLIGCNLPFDTVDSHHFKQFINKINKDYLVPSSSDLTRIVLSQLEKSTPPKSSKKRKNYETTESDSDDE